MVALYRRRRLLFVARAAVDSVCRMLYNGENRRNTAVRDTPANYYATDNNLPFSPLYGDPPYTGSAFSGSARSLSGVKPTAAPVSNSLAGDRFFAGSRKPFTKKDQALQKARSFAKSCWCRWRGSNPHGIATNGF